MQFASYSYGGNSVRESSGGGVCDGSNIQRSELQEVSSLREPKIQL